MFFLLDSLSIARVNVSVVWSLLFVGTGVAFLLEWKYAKRSAAQGSSTSALLGGNLAFLGCRRDGFYVVLLHQIIQSREFFRLNLAPSRQLRF